MPSKVWDEITFPIPKLQQLHLEFGEWISNFILHFIMDVITVFIHAGIKVNPCT